ncbi:35077_t:CDS:2 [Gigaspora margarita]|uniref:35077_t:CDS:1 n=1 Tax=Gigaspora margarita TaxID=4874 RepID=A0ABN7VRT7_GIGMA|nr:35077_t:CDS:2 [Gigaspora margarita]
MDSSDEDVDVSSFKLTSDQSFHTWDDIEKVLNNYGLEKENVLKSYVKSVGSVVVQANIRQRRCWIQIIREIDSSRQQIVNGKLITQLVVTAMLEDEAENSFVWALKMIKKCTSDLIPNVVFTNSDPAMNSTINLEFSNSFHYLCIFHIDLNLKKNLRNKLGLSEFKEFPGANSTQRVEVKFITLELTKKIQELLDKESEYARIEEYKEQISTISLPTISKTYFNSIENIISQYLLLVLRCSNQAKWHIGLIAAHWYKDNFDDIWQQCPITICTSSDQVYDQGSVEYPQKYGRAQGIMRKALDIALTTNSYDEWMGICYGFILDKATTNNIDDIEYDIQNPVISA